MEPEKKTRRSRVWLLALVVPLVMILIVAIVAIRWLGSDPDVPDVAQGPAPPIAPEPESPPPAWRAELSTAAKTQSLVPAAYSPSPDKIRELVAALDPQLETVPQVKAAPASLLVLPGEVRGVESSSRIPRHERWEFEFPPGNTIDSYSRQLDFFKIELGIIAGTDQVTYLANLSAPTPTARSGASGDDQRLYLIWQRGLMREAAEELVRRAKIDPRGKVLAHFCPLELEKQLADLEEEHARQQGLGKIRRTTFGIRPNETGGYVFYVMTQRADQQ